MYKLIDLKVFEDYRGKLKKVFTKSLLVENDFGLPEESYVITFSASDIVRGEHFHKHTNEIFSVLRGKCRFELVENGNSLVFDIDENDRKSLLVMKNTPHKIRSLIGESIVLAISSKEYSENDTDTFSHVF